MWITRSTGSPLSSLLTIRSSTGVAGALADQQALHLDDQDDRDDPEQDADGDRAQRVEHRVRR